MQQFIDLYTGGRVLDALRLIHTSPASSLEDYPYPLLANYTDAMIWGCFSSVFCTNRHLRYSVEDGKFQQALDEDVDRLILFQEAGLPPPFFPFSYIPEHPLFLQPSLLFMEIYDIVWSYTDSLLIFYERTQLQQFLYRHPLVENYYLLDSYPEQQFERFPPYWEDLPHCSLSQRGADPQFIDLLKRAFRTRASYDLQTVYKHGLELRDLWRAQRWGGSRIYTQILNRDFERRYDPHKEIHAPIVLGDSLEAIESRTLARLRPLRKRKMSKGKKRLAHIVSKICDENNSAPSQVLRTFIDHHDRDCFEIFVYSHEQYIPYTIDYPCLEYQARPTQEAAKKTLEYFESLGVTTDIGGGQGTFEDRAHILAEKLSQDEIDIGIFHQYPPINAITATLSDLPMRVYLDHGMRLPVFNSFDLLIISHLEESSQVQGASSVDIPMLTDSRQQWEAQPYPRSYFSIPEDSQCLATVSNCLEERLSPHMCALIAAVLRERPHVYYILIGPLRSMTLQTRFLELGVLSQIRFMGNQKAPSQLLRSVDVYLNEFPVGGSFAVLDAMASGRPVATLYSKEGPPQSRYAGVYIGKEWAAKTLEEYYILVCRLLDDPTYFRLWEEHMREQYRQRIHPRAYVRAVEKAVFQEERPYHWDKSYEHVR